MGGQRKKLASKQAQFYNVAQQFNIIIATGSRSCPGRIFLLLHLSFLGSRPGFLALVLSDCRLSPPPSSVRRTTG